MSDSVADDDVIGELLLQWEEARQKGHDLPVEQLCAHCPHLAEEVGKRIGAVLAMPMSLVTAPLGVKAAHVMSKRTLEVAFGLYLLIVGSRFVLSLVGGQ